MSPLVCSSRNLEKQFKLLTSSGDGVRDSSNLSWTKCTTSWAKEANTLKGAHRRNEYTSARFLETDTEGKLAYSHRSLSSNSLIVPALVGLPFGPPNDQLRLSNAVPIHGSHEARRLVERLFFSDFIFCCHGTGP
jgi:hypothetical protein